VCGSAETAFRALDGVSVEFSAGSFTAMMEPSGSGESTLMHCLAGLDTATHGSVMVGGTKIPGLDDREIEGLEDEPHSVPPQGGQGAAGSGRPAPSARPVKQWSWTSLGGSWVWWCCSPWRRRYLLRAAGAAGGQGDADPGAGRWMSGPAPQDRLARLAALSLP